jgi:ribonuclease HI
MRQLQENSLFHGIDGQTYLVYTDGASKGNPGRSSIGVVITDDQGVTLAEIGEDIGIATNNEAEYRALLRGLKEALNLQLTHVVWITDSELLALQWVGRYRVKAENLQPLYHEAKRLSQSFESFTVKHTLRDGNKRADALANQALKPKRPLY